MLSCIILNAVYNRGVGKSGIPPALGAGNRQFKSDLPDLTSKSGFDSRHGMVLRALVAR